MHFCMVLAPDSAFVTPSWFLYEKLISRSADAPHYPMTFDPLAGLERWSFTLYSDHLGELQYRLSFHSVKRMCR